jgi:hypothetical protein
MKLKLYINDEVYDIKIKDENVIEYNQPKINRSIKTILKRKHKIELVDKMVNDLNFEIEKCRLCDTEYPPVYGVFDITDKIVTITGFEYQKEIYCYCKNENCEGKKMNSNSVEFLSKLYKVDETEAMVILKSRNKSPFYAENWDDDESYKKYQRRDEEFFDKHDNITYDQYVNKISFANSLEGYISKYGEEEGRIIFDEISSKKDSMSMKYCLEKCGDEKEALYLYDMRKKSVNVSLESLIERHGEEKGNEINENRKTKLSYNNTIDAYIERHGLEEGTIKYTKRLKTISYKGTFAYCKEKYGDDAERIWMVRNISRRTNPKYFVELYGDTDLAEERRFYYLSKRITTGTVSKESVDFFDKLTDYVVNVLSIPLDDISYNKGNELRLIGDSTFYLYDYTIKNHNIIIEYNGVKFHPNKDELTLNEWNNWKSVRGNKTADEAYTRQVEKINCAESFGYSVLEIWNNKPFHINFDICVNYIKEKINKNEEN